MQNQPQIIFQDDHLLVINKPSGWVVNRAKSVKGPTIQDWVVKHFFSGKARPLRYLKGRAFPSSEVINNFLARSGIVHRLDKDTSGLLIIAKTSKSFINLQKQFKDRQVKKTYLALVHGRVEPGEGTISVPVGRQTFNRKKFGVIPTGRPSITKYEVDRYYSSSGTPVLHRDHEVEKPGPSPSLEFSTTAPFDAWQAGSNNNLSKVKRSNVPQYTLLRLHPQTGRTHQLRVHLKYIGHPIVSDPLYVGKKTLKKDLQWCPRLFLHAYKLDFIHPQFDKSIKLVANLPNDLQIAISKPLSILKVSRRQIELI